MTGTRADRGCSFAFLIFVMYLERFQEFQGFQEFQRLHLTNVDFFVCEKSEEASSYGNLWNF
ncbi:MAG: hypothetical protein DI535_03315 [Citrobacter freundii]|nr:MAG: hypothetical protein DI535_03315 [Citrobacter freundii]